MSELVLRYFVVLRDPGCAPEKKGPFLTAALMYSFLRDAIACRAPETIITAVRVTWDNDLWVDDGRELIHIGDALAEVAGG